MKLFLSVFFVFLPISSLAVGDSDIDIIMIVDSSPSNLEGLLSNEVEKFSYMSVMENCEYRGGQKDLLDGYYTPAIMGWCLKRNIEDIFSRLSSARILLKEHEASADEVAIGMSKLDVIQFKFNQKLYEMAQALEDDLLLLESAEQSTAPAVQQFLRHEQIKEIKALLYVLDVEQYQ